MNAGSDCLEVYDKGVSWFRESEFNQIVEEQSEDIKTKGDLVILVEVLTDLLQTILDFIVWILEKIKQIFTFLFIILEVFYIAMIF